MGCLALGSVGQVQSVGGGLGCVGKQRGRGQGGWAWLSVSLRLRWAWAPASPTHQVRPLLGAASTPLPRIPSALEVT